MRSLAPKTNLLYLPSKRRGTTHTKTRCLLKQLILLSTLTPSFLQKQSKDTGSHDPCHHNVRRGCLASLFSRFSRSQAPAWECACARSSCFFFPGGAAQIPPGFSLWLFGFAGETNC